MTRSPKEVLFGERMRKVARDVVERRRTVLLGEPTSDTSDTGPIGDASKSARARTSKGVSERETPETGVSRHPKRPKGVAAKLDANERERKALELRVAGQSLADIARDCGYANELAAWKAVHKYLDQQPHENAEQLRALWRERFELAVQAVLPSVRTGDSDAISSLVRVGERVAKLEGLDAKQEVEITMKAKQLEELPPAELLSKVRMQRAKLDEIEAKLLAEHPELRRPEFVPSKKGKGA